MNIKYSSLFLILIFLIFILIQKKERFLSPAVLEIQLEENREKYKKFEELQKKILESSNFQIGYKPLENTNEKTIGICPLGKFFDGEIPENISPSNLKQCKKCTPCNPGYYLREGCAGDSNSVCESEKVPHDIYVKSHGEYKKIHNLINPHKHPHSFTNEPNVVPNHKTSSYKHSHI